MAISRKVKSSLNGASWVRRMFEVGDELKQIHGEENVYDFSLGNPNLEPPPSLKKALKELADHPIAGMHRYMPNNGYSETRRTIAEYIKEESGLPFTENHIVMTVGAAGGTQCRPLNPSSMREMKSSFLPLISWNSSFISITTEERSGWSKQTTIFP